MKAKILAAGFIAALICALKYPRRLIHGYLWAEDGLVFIQEAAEHGFRALGMPYAGYLHAVPRLIVWLWMSVVRPELFPHVFAWSCIAIYAAIGAALFGLSRRHFPSGARGDAGAFVIAWLPFTVPQSPEIYITVTNLQWVLAPVLAFLLIDLSSGVDSTGRRFASFLLTTTGPFGVMLLPAVGISVAVRKERKLSPLFLYFAGCGLQIWAYLSAHSATPRPSFNGYPWSADYIRGALYEVFWPHAGAINNATLPFAAILIIGLALVACLNGWKSARVAVPLFAVAAALWFIGVIRQATPAEPIHWFGYGARYVYLPELCMTFALVLAIRSGSRAAGKACALALLIGMAIKTPIHPSATGDRTLVTRSGADVEMDFPPAETLLIKATR